MDEEKLTALRYKSEGTDIDFKSAQYRFIGATDEDKSELLKDILAMANAWRDGPGYILLGFKDQRPQPAEVVGIASSIDDAALQQFVSSKVKPKLIFRYEEHLFQGKTIGVISIPKQKRPFYLANPYGRLKKNIAYVRRGSSTDEAEPTEVAQMALADSGRADMRLSLEILAPDNGPVPEKFELEFLSFPAKLPDYESPRQSFGQFEVHIHTSIEHDNRDYWREYAKYARINAALIEMRFVLRNISEAQLTNAKLEVIAECLDGQALDMVVGADLPSAPRRTWNPIKDMRTLPEILDRRESRMVVEDRSGVAVCHIRLGLLLPGEEATSPDTLAIVPRGPGRIRLAIRTLGGELPVPLEEERTLEISGKLVSTDFNGLREMRDKAIAKGYRPSLK